MLDRLFNLLRPPEAKASRTAQLIHIESGGRARWTPRDYAALAREGFICNAIVHRAVKLVAENVAGVSWLVYEGAELREPHPLSDLLAGPIHARSGRYFSKRSARTCCWPATPISRRCQWKARARRTCASFTRCGPTGCAWCQAPTAGRKPTNIQSARAACGSTRARRCRRSCI